MSAPPPPPPTARFPGQSFVYFFRTHVSLMDWNENFADVWWREYYQRGAALPRIAADYANSEYFLFVGDADEIPSIRCNVSPSHAQTMPTY